ncbi:MAG: TldD/PmbA family protein [Deltaproteobacteria bacterium]|nr:MAG: TldD/PmbA family protein [Deltaproteobacteria bacterium]
MNNVDSEIQFLKKYLESISTSSSKTASIDHYEIYWEERQKQSFQSKDCQIEQIEESLERGLALRLFKGQRKAFSCTSDLSEMGLKKAASSALESLALLGEETSFDLPKSSSTQKSFLSQNPSREEKIEMALSLERAARAFDHRVSKVRDVRFEEEKKKILLINSCGAENFFEDVIYEMSLMVVSQGNSGSQEMAWESDFSHHFSMLNAESLARSAAEKSVMLLGAQSIPTQKTPAVLDPIVTSAFLNVLAQSFCADQIYKGRSYLKNRLGQQVYAPSINLIEDPLNEKSYDRSPFDAEGVSSQKTVLVEKGSVKNFITDLQMAKTLNVMPTGHAVRSQYKESPHISPRRFSLLPGRFSTEDLLEEMGKGFFVQDVIGAHTIDPVSGDFSLGATGLWMEKGKRRSAVRGVTISGNLHDIFRKVDKVGSLVREYQSFGAASLLVSSIDVAG